MNGAGVLVGGVEGDGRQGLVVGAVRSNGGLFSLLKKEKREKKRKRTEVRNGVPLSLFV